MWSLEKAWSTWSDMKRFSKNSTASFSLSSIGFYSDFVDAWLSACLPEFNTCNLLLLGDEKGYRSRCFYSGRANCQVEDAREPSFGVVVSAAFRASTMRRRRCRRQIGMDPFLSDTWTQLRIHNFWTVDDTNFGEREVPQTLKYKILLDFVQGVSPNT